MPVSTRSLPLLLACLLALGAAACGGASRSAGHRGSLSAEPVSALGSAPSQAGARECSPQRPEPAGTTHRTLDHDGLRREYVLAVPDGYDGVEPAPLVVDLHGFGKSALDQAATSDSITLAGSRGAVVAIPQGALLRLPPGAPDAIAENPTFADKPWWNFPGSGGIVFEPGEIAFRVHPSMLGSDDLGFLTELVASLERTLCIDSRRVFVMGMSNGAGMADDLACRAPDGIAAIGAVSGVNISGDCTPSKPVSVIAVHGDDDHIVPYDGGVLVGNRVDNPSVPDRARAWAEADGCDPAPRDATPAPGVTVTVWSGCRAGTSVELWTVHGADHGWPLGPDSPTAPGPVNATAAILDFFDAHPMAATPGG
jgi:polyhydroxybutyrate depolymerase